MNFTIYGRVHRKGKRVSKEEAAEIIRRTDAFLWPGKLISGGPKEED